MDELIANLATAFAAAGVEVPEDPRAMALDSLDDLVDDRRLRGQCKAALVKFQRAAEAEGWSPGTTPAPTPGTAQDAPADPAPSPAAVTPEATAPDTAVSPADDAEAPTAPAAGGAYSADLLEKLAAVEAAFEAAGVAMPDDLLAFDLDDLDELVPDRLPRGKCKAALVKFRRVAEAEGWSPAAAAPAPASTAPASTTPPPAGSAGPLPEGLQPLHEVVVAAFEAAGAALPADLLGFDLDDLDELIPDRLPRGKCKAALVKFRRAAEAEGWSSGSAPAAAASTDAGPAPTAPAPAAAMPEALQPLHEALIAAFGAAGVPVPGDLLGFDPAGLDELVEDKSARGKCKAALVKFRRAAEAAGWSPGALPAPDSVAAPAATAVAPAPEPETPAPTPEAEPPAPRPEPILGVPVNPEAPPTDLFLLTAEGWQRLGTAKRIVMQHDELVGGWHHDPARPRITSILMLDGTFDVPQDLYNTHCYIAHEDIIYKAYYLSHYGDHNKNTKIASLKVEEHYTYVEFAKTFVSLDRHLRPTGEDLRRRRFGGQYDADRRMFADPDARRLL